MKLSELTAATVRKFCRIEEDAEDAALVDTLFLPAAKGFIAGKTGMTEEQLEDKADVPVAVCCLVCQMYDYRSVVIDSDTLNPVVADIIAKYDSNLIPEVE